jgi:hypothetical protein
MHYDLWGHVTAICRDIYIHTAANFQILIANMIECTQDILSISWYFNFSFTNLLA